MDTFRAIRRVLWITMVLNLVATAAKLVIGFWTGSLSLIADGFDSVFDSASNIIGLVGIAMAARPADEDHPYGHRKAETMTALIIASLLFLTTWELIQSAVERLRNPALIQAEVNIWSFGALVVSIGVHLLVVWYELRAGRRLRSEVLVADALHTRADIFVSLAVMAGLIAVRLGYPLADPILALVVALVIAKIGVDIIRESAPTLMDRTIMPADQVERIALSVPGVISCHRVRSRGHEQAVYADLHIRVHPAMSTEQAHALAHEVQSRLRKHLADIRDVTIHVEPAGSLAETPGQEGITTRLRRMADGLGVAIHDVWAREVDGRYRVELHLEADGGLALQDAHRIASALEEKARAALPEVGELTIHIEPEGQFVSTLAPGAAEAEVAETVRQVANGSLPAGSCHRIQVLHSDPGWAVSMHCHLPGQITLAEAHRMSGDLERSLREKLPGLGRVTIHTEPGEA